MHKVAGCIADLITNFRILHGFQLRTMPFYAVASGFQVGIYDTWSACESQVKGFSKPKFRKFKTMDEAEKFLSENGINVQAVPRPSYMRNATSPLRSSTAKSKYYQEQLKASEEPPRTDIHLDTKEVKSESSPPLPEIEDHWPDEVEIGQEDDDLLLAAAEEVEGIPESSRKRKGSSVVNAPESSKITKKYKHDSKIWEPIGLKMIGKFEFPIDSEGYVIVYTDGSCINNGQAGAVAGYGVYFSEGHALNAAEPVKGRVTNNAGEIQASIHAIRVAKDFGIKKLCLSTDSQFLINAVTSWIKGWKRKGWKIKTGEPVKNVDDFIILDELLDGSIEIKWNYVKGHKGIVGNEKADRLARKGADLYRKMMAKKS